VYRPEQNDVRIKAIRRSASPRANGNITGLIATKTQIIPMAKRMRRRGTTMSIIRINSPPIGVIPLFC
jgi:hypothetical protein